MDARTEENAQRSEVEADLMDHVETMIDQTISDFSDVHLKEKILKRQGC